VLNNRIAVPFYVWPLAFVAGILVAAGSLSYSPQGRINVLWVWLIWAGLPLLGTLASLFFAAFGSSRPWLFQWGKRSFSWYPSPAQRAHMLWLLQAVWCVFGLGMLTGFLALLLFSDLAFGWSSTLVQDPETALSAAQWLALPWQPLWPSAVPTAEMIAATHYQRINPTATDPALAGQWWRFLMASLIFYNLLPRTLLAAVFYIRWRWRLQPQLSVRSSSPLTNRNAHHPELTQDTLDHWQQALRVNWELQDATGAATLGLRSWSEDEVQLNQLLDKKPHQLLWQVKASRSPVAELSDLMTKARQAGVQRQALKAQTDAETEPERHLASWQAFARQHQLIWIADE
jgi:hypothetical protein